MQNKWKEKHSHVHNTMHTYTCINYPEKKRIKVVDKDKERKFQK